LYPIPVALPLTIATLFLFADILLLLLILLQIVSVVSSIYLGRLQKCNTDRLYYNVIFEIRNGFFGTAFVLFYLLINMLNTAVDNNGTLGKKPTSYNDIFDAFRLALKFYLFRNMSEYD
jgi:hypothetical protein